MEKVGSGTLSEKECSLRLMEEEAKDCRRQCASSVGCLRKSPLSVVGLALGCSTAWDYLGETAADVSKWVQAKESSSAS